MTDFGIKRNASGYYDETAYKGMTAMQPGEVWSTDYGNEVLVIAVHENHVTGLLLKEKSMAFVDGLMPVYGDMVTDPSMVGYIFKSKIFSYVKRIPDADFMEIMDAVNHVLSTNIIITVERVEEPVKEERPAPIGPDEKALHVLRLENERLKGQVTAYKDFLGMLMGKEQ